MNNQLTHIIAEQRVAEMVRAAEQQRLANGGQRTRRARVRWLVGSRSGFGRIATTRV